MTESLALSVIAGFEAFTEQDIASMEFGPLSRSLPEEERALLYALRVSRCVPRLKKLSTLASRCSVAHCGAGGMGLDAGRNSPHWAAVRDFLQSLYLARFDAIASDLLQRTAVATSTGRRSTPMAVRIERAIEELDLPAELMAKDFPSARERADHWNTSLRGLLDAEPENAPVLSLDAASPDLRKDPEPAAPSDLGSVLVEVSHTSVICFALEQVGTPIVSQVRFLSQYPQPKTGLLIECSIAPDLVPSAQFPVPELRLGEGVEIGPLDFRLPPGRLREVLEAERARLQWRLLDGNEELAAGEKELEVLAYNEWPGARAPGALLASFITPNHPVISRILGRVRDRLLADTQDGGIGGYQSRLKTRVLEELRALYSTIQELGITYIGLPASFEKQGQKVRLPDVVLDGQMGNCLDISILFASCMEQMGLAPLIVLVQGHAFPAVWTIDERFPEVLVPDVSRLRNQIELGQIVVFDSSTSVSAGRPRLEAAIDEGRRYLTSDGTFLFAVDVRAARTDRYRPLPIRMSVSPEESGSPTPSDARGLAELILEESFQTPDAPAEDAPSQPPTTVDARFKVWRDRLLDLSLHNRLLNFRPASGQAIPLDVPSLGQFEDLLAAGERFQVLPVPPRDATDQRSRDLAAARDDDGRRHQLLTDLIAKRVHARYAEAELFSRARELARQAKTDLEEGGVTTTFAAIGLLKWYESTASEMARFAPLLLVPLKLEYEPRTQRVLMLRGEDDAVGNVTLSEKMRRDFSIDLSTLADLQADESGVEVKALLRDVRAGIQRMPRWEVVEEVHIGHFTFAKFLMWKDLEDNRGALLANPVVRHIAEGGKETFPDPVGEVHVNDLDDSVSPADLPAVVDADSTQFAAVVSAVRGRSFVLEGPPGTGKSQTITNLIASSLAAGKTVLFVSEKMAALEVVHRRLDQVGLGDFCLELHSNKANKKQVLESLRRAYERGKHTGDADWQGRSARLHSLRQHLNGYVRALHQSWPVGLTFYKASARALELQSAPRVGVPIHVGPSLSQETLHRWLETADLLAVHARRIEPVSGHAWRASEILEWSSVIQGQIEASLAAALAALKEAELASADLANSCGFEAAKNCERMDALSAAVQVAAGGGIPRIAWSEDRWPATEREALEWVALVERQARDREELGRRWSEEFHEADLESLRAVYLRRQASNRLVAWFALRSARAELQPLARGKLPERGLILKDLQAALTCRDRESDLRERQARLSSVLGTTWNEPGSVPSLSSVIEKSRAALGIARQLRTLEVPLPERVLSTGERESVDASLANVARRAGDAIRALSGALRDVGAVAHVARVLPGGSSADQFAQARHLIQSLRDAMPVLRNWCHYAKACALLSEMGLGDVVVAHREGRVPAVDLRKAIERSVLETWVERVRDAEQALREFSGDTRDKAVVRFREEDREHLNAARQMVQGRIDARRPAMLADPSAGSEAGVLLGQMRLQRRHMAIRKLFDRIPNLLPKLKPCMLMSPLSVAQYLPATGRRFDLVVFDEASQIATHDAIGAIGRGNQVIVVGDSRQLPPTSFFQRNLDDDDAATDDNDVVELESVLDEACRVRIPRQWLGWHYRSRHDSLIDFSNRHYYENRLQIYASASWRADDLGVHWIHVPDGVYQLGKSRTNPREAECVVETLVAELRKTEPGKRTFGIVTFSVSQQTEVENRLDQARVQYPEIEGHFSEDLVEPVFVKNLENVQGDERDEILLSVCYGPDERGRVYMNFGPINRTGGERRLNVAITRARRMLRVFSTLRHDQIDLARTNSTGARHLRSFLQYAAERGSHQEARPSAKAFDSEFERQVHDELLLRGYEIDCQVGCAGYRIDLAIRHPKRPGTYALGIECDGAPYHSASTARDRDRLRQQVLEGLGWTMHRIWSSDWWFDREREVEKLIASVEAALVRSPIAEAKPTPRAQPVDVRVNQAAPAPVIAVEGPPTTPYRRAKLQVVRRAGMDIHSRESAKELSQRVEEVVRVEGPVHIDDLAKSVARCFGVGRVTERVRVTVRGAIEALAASRQASIRDEFAWPPTTSPAQWKGIRVPDSGEDPRDLDQVPLEEIANAMRWHLSHSLSVPFRELARATLRTLGYGSLTRRAEERVRAALALLVSGGWAIERDDMLEWRER